MRMVKVHSCANGALCDASVDDSDRSVLVFTKAGVAMGYVEFQDINRPIDGRYDGKVCPRCVTNLSRIVNNLAAPKDHPIIYCWNCGQAIKWNKEVE